MPQLRMRQSQSPNMVGDWPNLVHIYPCKHSRLLSLLDLILYAIINDDIIEEEEEVLLYRTSIMCNRNSNTYHIISYQLV